LTGKFSAEVEIVLLMITFDPALAKFPVPVVIGRLVVELPDAVRVKLLALPTDRITNALLTVVGWSDRMCGNEKL
jgi:hypothetical protein